MRQPHTQRWMLQRLLRYVIHLDSFHGSNSTMGVTASLYMTVRVRGSLSAVLGPMTGTNSTGVCKLVLAMLAISSPAHTAGWQRGSISLLDPQVDLGMWASRVTALGHILAARCCCC